MSLPRCRTFGQIAVERGYVKPDQVRKALAIQRASANGLKPLLGIVMVREGMISPAQLIRIVKLYHARRRAKFLAAARHGMTPDLAGAPLFF